MFVGLFAVLLCSVPSAKILGIGDGQLSEKRELAAMTKWPSSLQDWGKLPSAVDQYANDHFAMRAELISTDSYIRYRLGLSASPKILVGSNGWMYYIGDPDFKFIRGRNRLSSADVANWVHSMESRQKWLAERGARFLIFPAPIKERIYPEHLPSWLQRDAAPTLVEQLIQAGRDRVAIVNVRNRLLERKTHVDVYTPFDTHWNAEGAFVGYTAIMEQLSGTGVQPLRRESITFHPESGDKDMVLMLGIGGFVKVEGLSYTPKSSGSIQIQYLTSRTDPYSPQMIKSGIPGTPTLMVVGDSYSMGLLPYLEDTFGTIVWRHVQDGSFPQADMERYRPDIVLLEVQEAGLGVM